MAISSGRVPMLDGSGRFPDRFAPPSVASDAAAALAAKVAAELAASGAVGAEAGAVAAKDAAVVVQSDVTSKAALATSAASAAAGSASAADGSASAAAVSAGTAGTKATEAAASQSAAAGSASAAGTSATDAASSATAASNAQTGAESARDAAQVSASVAAAAPANDANVAAQVTGGAATIAALNATYALKGEVAPAPGVTFVTLTTTAQAITLGADSVIGLALTQGTGGSKTAAWPAGVRWDGGAAPTLSTGAGAIDVVTLVADGTGGWLGKLDGRYAAPSDTTPPSAVTNLVAGTATSTTIPLSWTAATDNVAVTGYEYSTNGTSYTTTGSTGTTYTVTGLTASTAYTVYVRAFDAAGNRGAAASVAKTTGANVVSLKTAISNLSPTLFAPLDDAPGTTAPVNLGTGGAALTVSGSGTFGNAGIAGGTGSWAGTGSVNAPQATLDGTTENSGFMVLKAATTPPVGAGGRPLGSAVSWGMTIGALSGGAEIGVGMAFSDAVQFYTSSGVKKPVGQVLTVGWSLTPTGAYFYLNGSKVWTGAATTMKAGASTKSVAGSADSTTLQYATALWSGTSLSDAQHLTLAQAAGVA